MSSKTTNIDLIEYKPRSFPQNFLEENVAKLIWQQFSNFVSIEQPGWQNDYQWTLTSNGWVGFIPVNNETTLSLLPKVPLSNLFRMLEYAYNLNPFKVEGLFECKSLNEYYENLAMVLANRAIDRKRKGLYKHYVDLQDSLPYLRGRIQFSETFRKPWDVKLPSRYQEHTPDISDNQLLAWTLHIIIRSGICSDRSDSTIRKAFREYQKLVQVFPFSPQDCLNRLYDRLNEDYQPMHILCRFFLENSGPILGVGNKSMLPFVINMADLFELFLAEWLKDKMPAKYELLPHEKFKFGLLGNIEFDIDLVIIEKETRRTIYVLDTKYKNPDSPASSDVHQIVAYSVARQCKNAILIYPAELPSPFAGKIDDILVRSLSFSLDDDIEAAGRRFLSSLFPSQSI